MDHLVLNNDLSFWVVSSTVKTIAWQQLDWVQYHG